MNKRYSIYLRKVILTSLWMNMIKLTWKFEAFRQSYDFCLQWSYFQTFVLMAMLEAFSARCCLFLYLLYSFFTKWQIFKSEKLFLWLVFECCSTGLHAVFLIIVPTVTLIWCPDNFHMITCLYTQLFILYNILYSYISQSLHFDINWPFIVIFFIYQ